MKVELFDKEMIRIKDVYGPRFYPAERIRVLWKEFEAYNYEKFVEIIDHLIGYNKFPPMLEDFLTLKAKNREQAWEKEKRESARDAQRIFNQQETQDIFGAMGKLLTLGEPNKWDKFLKKLGEAPLAIACKWCEDSGLVYAINENEPKGLNATCFICFCKAGKNRPEAFPTWGRRYMDLGYYLENGGVNGNTGQPKTRTEGNPK